MNGFDRPEMGFRQGCRSVTGLWVIAVLGVLSVLFLLSSAGPVRGDGSGPAGGLETDFRQFLEIYIQKVHAEDAAFLAEVHPELPKEMYDFFFDVTQGMMRHAEKNALSPTVTCREYGVCKSTWPQPDDSWAAQTFIRHEGHWQWLAD